MALESFRGSLGFLCSRGGLGFNPGPITAPAERPVLSRQAVTGFEPQRGDL